MPIRKFSNLDSQKQSEPLPKESRIENLFPVKRKRVHKICTATSSLMRRLQVNNMKDMKRGGARDVHDNLSPADVGR